MTNPRVSDVPVPKRPDGQGTVQYFVTHPEPGVELAQAGASTALDDLTDVVVPAPTDGYVLTYVSANSRWEAVAASGGGLTQEQIQDMLDTFIVMGANITKSYNDAGNTLTLSLPDEAIDDRVANLLVAGTRIGLSYNDAGNTLTISVSGLVTSDLSDFAEAVQDQIGAHVKSGNSLITISYDDAGTGDTTATLDTTVLDERIRDTLGAALVAGNNIDITLNDGADTITIDVEALTSADIGDWAEAVDDRVNALLVAGTNISFSYNDAGNTLTINATGGGGSVATDAIWDAKGDLAGGTGANTAARLPVGTNGHVLTADSAEATGMKWAAASGGTAGDVVTKTTTYTAVNGDTILADATSAGFTITLPAVASSDNAIIRIKKIDSTTNLVTIDPNSTETIDGSSTSLTLLTQYASVTLACNGSAWYIV